MGFPTAQASGKRGANAMEAQGNTRIRKEQRQRKLRRNPTDTERELWQSLRGKQLDGAKFRRQHPFGDYLLDFACIERKLVVELEDRKRCVQGKSVSVREDIDGSSITKKKNKYTHDKII